MVNNVGIEGVIIDGLQARHHTPLPGAPPTWEEQTQRWLTS